MDSETLRSQITQLLNQESPPIVELRKAMIELDDLINSSEFLSLDSEIRIIFQNFRRELKSCMVGDSSPPGTPTPDNLQRKNIKAPQENYKTSPIEIDKTPALADNSSATDSTQSDTSKQANPIHHPNAESQMEEAESLFYSGRYADAIKLFDRILQVEPKWERAKQHRSEAENYLRTGYIPPIALPSEAASAYGKAQSAARVGRYKDALALISKAQAVLRESGIQRWHEGHEFEQKLQENIDAEITYHEGINLFEHGQLDEAIDRLETAARATGLPKYGDRAQEFRKVRENLRSIHDTISSLTIDPKILAQAKTDLERMSAEYGANPALERLRTRMENIVPRVIQPLKESARSEKTQAENSERIEDAIFHVKNARVSIDLIRALDNLDETVQSTNNEVERLFIQAQKAQTDLDLARSVLETNRNWAAQTQASQIERQLRHRYPSDPNIIQLQRDLGSYYFIRALTRILIGVIALIALTGFGWFAYNRYASYQLSLTPTATPTATNTGTSTPTPSSTPTTTPTPTATASPTPTPTPLSAIAIRDIWARNGCYEGFTATGRIPTGGQIFFLSAERRFDNFNRECALVEFRQGDISIVGWVLLLDIGPAP